MKKEFEIFVDVMNPKTGKITKKDIICKRTFETDNIEVEQFLSNTGKIIPKHCFIYIGDKCYKVNHSYDYVNQLISPIKVEGLIVKSKRYKNGRMV